MGKWPHCPRHGGHCYITNGGSYNAEHFNFEPNEWAIWVTALLNNQAILDYPPRTQEMDMIIEKHRNKSKGKKKPSKSRHRRSISTSDSDSTSKNKHVIINVTQPSLFPPGRRYSNPTSPSKAAAKEKPLVELLRLAGYKRQDYNTKALKDYLEWCGKNFPGDFLKAFSLLSEHEIGIDILDSIADAQTLCSQTKISYGVSTRILKHYHQWVKGIQVEVNSD